MTGLIKFFKSNRKEVGFGWMLTFLSSFGQTFLISIYVPEILNAFSISNGLFGSIYAIATVTSSIIMLTVGHLVDHKAVKKITALTVAGLALSSFLLGISHLSIAILIVALIGLRLTGQGLMSHISLTVMSRHYELDRGKALSIASLGYAIGEAVFPICISSLILWYDYEVAALASAAFLVVYLVRLYFSDLSHFDADLEQVDKPSALSLLKDYRELLKTKAFFILMPVSFALSFTITAVFFYQYVVVEDKGWSVSLYASFFTVYAIVRVIFSIYGGVLVDKYSGKQIFRLYLVPFTIGLLPFAYFDSIFGALAFLILAGMSTGMAGTVKSAVLAEVFGTAKLGTIRSVFTMFMVLSTALGPLLFGTLMDAGISFQYILFGNAIVLLLVILNAQRIKGLGVIS
ncbi:MFS transporter [Gramella sp. GC03-9]|uniref:MFS transporter n=1 Tax=Christiangramia oceanisediminis TaxID=2920386 RepID=A0A9X2I3R6_9FLAO|nr:MFS transporter [Gramella oceanisediminis]MCP9198812.1 MFS transporter [Gramella oceanisediminis]